MKSVILIAVLLLSSVTVATATAIPSAAGLSPQLAYDEAYWSRPHNPYLKAHFDDVLDVLHRGNRVLELDLWESSGQIVVKHEPWQGNFDNNCQGGAGGTFVDCLRDVAFWSDSNPHHWPITLQLDLKAGLWFGWGANARAQLNSVLAQELGQRIITPEEIRQFTGSPSLRTGVYNQGWPTLDAMRGRILVLITGGPIGAKNQTQRAYVEQFGAQAMALVCPEADSGAHFWAQGAAKDFQNSPANAWVVCGNTRADKFWSNVVEGAADNRQIVNLWAPNDLLFDQFHQAYIAVASGASMISRETLDDYGNLIPLNGARRSVPNRFALRALHSELCLDVSGGQYSNGVAINQWPCHGGSNQEWRYSDETQLRAVANEAFCFDIEGGQSVAGKPLHIWRCDGGASEKWQLTPEGYLVGMGGRCAEVPNGSTQPGVQARLNNCSPSGLHQRFSVIVP